MKFEELRSEALPFGMRLVYVWKLKILINKLRFKFTRFKFKKMQK